MILTIRQKQETLDHAGDAAAALYGAGLLQKFADGHVMRIAAAGNAVQVTCETAKGGYAKSGFIAAGFEVPSPAGPAPNPPEENPVSITVAPGLPDVNQNYPLGAQATGRVAAKALFGACVTLPSAANGDAYDGDPGTSMQVRCNQADLAAVSAGFFADKFTVAR